MAYEVLLVPIAAGMVVATALLVKMSAQARTTARAAGTVFLLAMMEAMLLGGLVYLLAPSTAGLVDALWVTSAVMSLAVVPIFWQFLRDARRQIAEGGTGYASQPFRPSVRFSLLVLALVVSSEFLMGLVFELASGTPWASLTAGPSGAPLELLSQVVLSPWFVFTMAGEMALTVALLRRDLLAPFGVLLVGQVGIMVATPTALGGPTWPFGAIVAGSVVMIALVVYAMEFVYRNPELSRAAGAYVVRLLAIYGAMMAGILLWQASGDGLLLALALVAEMALYFDLVVRSGRLARSETFPWLRDARWTFGLLAGIFVAEIFMGAVLDQAILPGWYAGLGMWALSGSGTDVAVAAVHNGFLFLSAVTASVWFLAMMGAEMGTLVVYKLRETRSRETRVRLGVMLGSYAAFAVFFPSVYYTIVFPSAPDPSVVPLLGWSMGVGSAPLAPIVFGAVVGTYAFTAALSMAFGRRWLCSVFCTAPLMFQGTTIDAMKTFNRSSSIGHRYLGSRFSSLYSATLAITMAALVAVSLLSYLDAIGTLHTQILGLDPSVFFFALSFGVLWYLMFVLIPFVGNYNCVTMGWCYTGIIAQAFQSLGAFKLKVRDREVCRACTTLDCAKGCPVGLVDMPGHFRTKGEFRSSKCCGVGDCVEACPYGNLYIHDIRHLIGRWLRADAAPHRSGVALPMARSRPASPEPAKAHPASPDSAGR